MFIFNLTYQKPIEEVERALSEHIQYLDKYYQACKFICSGRKNPRTGGIILCNCADEDEAKRIMKEDPFYQKGIAKYELLEFFPTKHTKDFEKCID